MYTNFVTMSAHSRCEKKRKGQNSWNCRNVILQNVWGSLAQLGKLWYTNPRRPGNADFLFITSLLISYLSNCCWFLIHHIAAVLAGSLFMNIIHEHAICININSSINIHICTVFWRGLKTWQRATYWLDSSVDPHILLVAPQHRIFCWRIRWIDFLFVCTC